MVRRLSFAVALVVVFVWALGGSVPNAAQAPAQGGAPSRPVRSNSRAIPTITRARSRSAISATSGPRMRTDPVPTRLTVNTAREVVSALFARRPLDRVLVEPLRQQRRLRRSRRRGGTPRQLTFFSGGDDVVGWSRDGQQVLFRSSHGDGAFPNVATLYQVPVAGGPEKPLPMDWGYYGDFSPDGKAARVQPPSRDVDAQALSRQLRGGYLDRRPRAEDVPAAAAPTSSYNRYWPMWGSDNNIYFVADPLPNDKSVKPGSLEVFKSANNIYKIPANGSGQPVQVTKHTSGSLFWPSMSGDGKVIVYEESFGIWKLDVASGRTTEIKIEIATDDKENEFEVATVQNEVDSFDLSPSGQRAVISARGQLLTIATTRGDITRIAPDPMASRNQTPKWSPDGKYIAYRVRQVRPRRNLGGRSGRQEPEADHEPRQREGRVARGRRIRRRCSTPRPTRSSTATRSPTPRRPSSRRTRWRASASFSISPDSKWVAFSKQDRTLRAHVYIAPIGGGEERHVSDDALLYSGSESGLDRRRPLSGLHVVRRLQQRHRDAGRHHDDDGAVGAAAARSGSRSVESRHRQRSAGAGGAGGGRRAAALAARAAARRDGADRLEQHRATRAADSACRATRSPDSSRRPTGASVAFNLSSTRRRGRTRRRRRPARPASTS